MPLIPLRTELGRRLTNAEGDSRQAYLFTQAAHGFTEGQLVYLTTGGVWALAKADDEATMADGIVVDGDNANTFRVCFKPIVLTWTSGLTVGARAYLSASTAGGAVTTRPNISQGVGKALSSSLFLFKLDAYEVRV